MIDVQQPFARVFPRDFVPWDGDQLFKEWEVEIVQKLLPQGDHHRKRWVRQSLFKDQSGEVSSGHGCDGVHKGELLLRYEKGYVPGSQETSQGYTRASDREGLDGSQDFPVNAFQYPRSQALPAHERKIERKTESLVNLSRKKRHRQRELNYMWANNSTLQQRCTSRFYCTDLRETKTVVLKIEF